MTKRRSANLLEELQEHGVVLGAVHDPATNRWHIKLLTGRSMYLSYRDVGIFYVGWLAATGADAGKAIMQELRQ